MIKYILSLILSITLAMPAMAQSDSKALADSAYAKEKYDEALKLYEQSTPSAAVYYNMGNCHYRLNHLAHAILYYERAHLLSPANADIQFNLTMARSKTVDKMVPRHEFFFVGWYRSLCNIMSVDSWAYWACASFLAALIAIMLYLFVYAERVRRIGIVSAVVLLLVCAFSNLFAYSQRSALLHRTSAIVMTNTGSVKSTPSASGKDLFVLHEGTRVEITDDSLQGWYEVELQDGKKGWIEAKLIEII